VGLVDLWWPQLATKKLHEVLSILNNAIHEANNENGCKAIAQAALILLYPVAPVYSAHLLIHTKKLSARTLH